MTLGDTMHGVAERVVPWTLSIVSRKVKLLFTKLAAEELTSSLLRFAETISIFGTKFPHGGLLVTVTKSRKPLVSLLISGNVYSPELGMILGFSKVFRDTIWATLLTRTKDRHLRPGHSRQEEGQLDYGKRNLPSPFPHFTVSAWFLSRVILL